MPILSWDKPKKIMTEERRRKEFSSDQEVPGTFVPNMSDADRAKWKAHFTGQRSGHLQVEIRKDTTVIVVSLGGIKYKNWKPEDRPDLDLHIASAGPLQCKAEELLAAITEARAFLLDKSGKKA